MSGTTAIRGKQRKGGDTEPAGQHEPGEGPSVEARLLASTEQLVYAGGIHATGMDAIVKASGVARKSIYRRYGTKDALVCAALHGRDRRWMAWFIRATSLSSDPAERLLSVFPALREWFETPDFHGCAFINAAGEIGDPANEIRAVATLHKRKLADYLDTLTRASGADDPGELARQFLILIDGATAVAMVTGDASAADSAGRAAALLLSSRLPGSGKASVQT